MLERVVENWLSKTKERSLQLAYCQVLAHRGERIVYISPHGPFEQGKDVVSLSVDGTPHAYQLKVGDVTLGRWRTEVWPEVEERLDIPIKHPAVDKAVPHRSWLVISGELKDEVRVQIDDRNAKRAREGKLPLEVVVGGQLL